LAACYVLETWGARGAPAERELGSSFEGRRRRPCGTARRGFDAVAPVIHEWTYEAMAFDLLGLEGNVFHYTAETAGGKAEPKSHLLDERDELCAPRARNPSLLAAGRRADGARAVCCTRRPLVQQAGGEAACAWRRIWTGAARRAYKVGSRAPCSRRRCGRHPASISARPASAHARAHQGSPAAVSGGGRESARRGRAGGWSCGTSTLASPRSAWRSCWTSSAPRTARRRPTRAAPTAARSTCARCAAWLRRCRSTGAARAWERLRGPHVIHNGRVGGLPVHGAIAHPARAALTWHPEMPDVHSMGALWRHRRRCPRAPLHLAAPAASCTARDRDVSVTRRPVSTQGPAGARASRGMPMGAGGAAASAAVTRRRHAQREQMETSFYHHFIVIIILL